MSNIFKKRNKNKNENIFHDNIHVGQQINANDIEDVTVNVETKFACCDCSKRSGLVGIVAGSAGFGIGSCQNIFCISVSKAFFIKVIIISLLLLSVGVIVSGRYKYKVVERKV